MRRGQRQDQVRDTVETYLTALADGDGERACDQLTGNARRKLVDSLTQQVPEVDATSCEDALAMVAANIGADEERTLKDAEITKVSGQGELGHSPARGADTDAELVKTDAGWLIDGGLGN